MDTKATTRTRAATPAAPYRMLFRRIALPPLAELEALCRQEEEEAGERELVDHKPRIDDALGVIGHLLPQIRVIDDGPQAEEEISKPRMSGSPKRMMRPVKAMTAAMIWLRARVEAKRPRETKTAPKSATPRYDEATAPQSIVAWVLTMST